MQAPGGAVPKKEKERRREGKIMSRDINKPHHKRHQAVDYVFSFGGSNREGDAGNSVCP